MPYITSHDPHLTMPYITSHDPCVLIMGAPSENKVIRLAHAKCKVKVNSLLTKTYQVPEPDSCVKLSQGSIWLAASSG